MIMEFLHVPNRRESHILRESIYATTFELPPSVLESRWRQNSIPVPRYHPSPDWPWHLEASVGNDQYVLSPDEQYLDHQEFPSQFGDGDTNHLPLRPSPPGSNRGSFPFPQFNIHNRNSTRSRSPHDIFQSNHARFGPHQQHCRHNHHHHGFPTDQREIVPPDISEPNGVAAPAAYSVEEPTTPPVASRSQNFPNTNPHYQNQRQSNGPEPPDIPCPLWRHRPSQSSPIHPAYLPPRTQRCETLPSSASSTAPSTPSQPSSSPASSPRPNSPVSDFLHDMHDHNNHNRNINNSSHDDFDTDMHSDQPHANHSHLHRTPRHQHHPHHPHHRSHHHHPHHFHQSHHFHPQPSHNDLPRPRPQVRRHDHHEKSTISLLSAQRRALRIQHRQLWAMRRELERLNRSLGESGRRHAGWEAESESGSEKESGSAG